MRHQGLAALLSAILMFASGAARSALPEGFSEAVLQIEVNGAAANEMVIALRDATDNIWLDADALATMRLRLPARQPLSIEGVPHYPLASISGAVVTFDETSQRVTLNVPAAAFERTDIALATKPVRKLSQATLGGFINYELGAEYDKQTGPSAPNATFGTAFLEQGFFGPQGVITNSLIGAHNEDESRMTRLETTWIYDLPERLQTVRVGDVIGSSGRWSRAARLGGVQWGSNFAVRPDLVTSPLLSAVGEAVVPSTVDVFVNAQQVSSQEVPAGPFVIDRLPAISGAGDVRLVVRDTFGREQVITAPFYSSPTLLQRGLAQYSVELGKIRENFAIESFDYGAPLIAGTYRRGFTEALTLEAHGEVQQEGPRAFGVDAALRVGSFGVVTATLAHGADDSDSGVLAALSLERGGRRFSFNARSQITSDGFRQVGDSRFIQRPKQQHSLMASANFYRFGSLSLAYAVATLPDEPRRQVGTLSHNIALPRIGYLGFTASHTWAAEKSTSAFLILTMPLGGARSASVSARYDQDPLFEQREMIATFQQNPPLGNGLGYRLSGTTEGNYAGSWLQQFDSAAVELETAKYLNTTAVRATVTGAAVGIGGDVYATRSVNDSFALVDIPDIPDMEVMVDNQVVRRTDEHGRALIRNLRAYDTNRISVDPRQLPLDTRIDSDRITVTPRYRSGVIVKFPVTRERGGTFRLIQQNGKPVPTGAEVLFKKQRFPVALNGLVFVSGLDHGMSGEAEWNGGRCVFRVGAPIGNDPMPDMGTIICRSLEREQ